MSAWLQGREVGDAACAATLSAGATHLPPRIATARRWIICERRVLHESAAERPVRLHGVGTMARGSRGEGSSGRRRQRSMVPSLNEMYSSSSPTRWHRSEVAGSSARPNKRARASLLSVGGCRQSRVRPPKEVRSMCTGTLWGRLVRIPGREVAPRRRGRCAEPHPLQDTSKGAAKLELYGHVPGGSRRALLQLGAP